MNKVMALLSSLKVQMRTCYRSGTNALGIYARVIVYMNNSISLIPGSERVLIFGIFFKSFSGAALFIVSGLTVCQTTHSKITTYLKKCI